MPSTGEDAPEGVVIPSRFAYRLVAKEEAEAAVDRHTHACPFAASRVEYRVRCLEISYGRLMGFLLGSGLLGGAAGGIAAKLLP